VNLIIHELITSLSQEYTTKHEVCNLLYVRPHLYRKGAPAGSVALQIQDQTGEVVAVSNTRVIADIGAGTYWHGVARFEITASLAPLTTYRFALVPTGYVHSPSAYLAWCNGFALGRYDTELEGFDAPLDLENWTRQQIRKGVY
jgi:hypothetical protein